MRSNAGHHAIWHDEEEKDVQRGQHKRPYGCEEEKSRAIEFISAEVVAVSVKLSNEKSRY